MKLGKLAKCKLQQTYVFLKTWNIRDKRLAVIQTLSELMLHIIISYIKLLKIWIITRPKHDEP